MEKDTNKRHGIIICINLQSYNGNNGMSVSQVTDVIEEMNENTNSTDDTHVNNSTDDAQVDTSRLSSTSTFIVRFV